MVLALLLPIYMKLVLAALAALGLQDPSPLFSMLQHQLMLAQPSLCNGSVSWVAHFLTQRPDTLLRYSTFVEIMAPTFDMGFFTNVVRHTFFTGISGYGALSRQ